MAKSKSNSASCIGLIFAIIVLIAIFGVVVYLATVLLPNAAAADFGEPKRDYLPLNGFNFRLCCC